LPHLPARPTQGIELLVDYFRSHIVTFIEYLGILQKKKVIDKATIKEHNITKSREREENRARKATMAMVATQQAIKRVAN
jgi:hypothetical protein